jgi:hypothetical protein
LAIRWDDRIEGSGEVMVSPLPVRTARPLAIRTRPAARRVTFVDVNKPNSSRILARARELLGERGFETPEPFVKRNPSKPLHKKALDRIARQRALILCGPAD